MAFTTIAPDECARGRFMVGGDDVPWSPRGRGRGQRLLVGLLVRVEVRPLGQIRRRELPLLGRIVEACEEPPSLFLLRDVEEELDHTGAVSMKMVLEGVDVLVASLPEPRARPRCPRGGAAAQSAPGGPGRRGPPRSTSG
jgi:hypothetical protein